MVSCTCWATGSKKKGEKRGPTARLLELARVDMDGEKRGPTRRLLELAKVDTGAKFFVECRLSGPSTKDPQCYLDFHQT